MNELIVLGIVVLITLIVYFTIGNLKPLARVYLRVTAFILLMLLVWFFADRSKLYFKVIITVITFTPILNEYRQLRKVRKEKDKLN